MELKGQLVTLYPISLQGAAMPRPFDFAAVIQAFHTGLLGELAQAGLDVRMPQPGTADMPIVIRLQAVKADPGSQLMRYFFTMFAGQAQFDAQGAVGDVNAPFGQLRGAGTRRAGLLGGDSTSLLSDAARMSGQRIGKQVVDVLTAR